MCGVFSIFLYFWVSDLYSLIYLNELMNYVHAATKMGAVSTNHDKYFIELLGE